MLYYWSEEVMVLYSHVYIENPYTLMAPLIFHLHLLMHKASKRFVYFFGVDRIVRNMNR